LADGSKAVGLFDLGDKPALASANWPKLKLRGPQLIRDPWRQKDLGERAAGFSAGNPRHGCMLIRAFSPK
jgi:alpha-galactosidase